MSATNSSSDSVTNGLWGIRIKIEALDVIPEEFRYLKIKSTLEIVENVGSVVDIFGCWFEISIDYTVWFSIV